MIVLIISSLGTGGKEKRFKQLSSYLEELGRDHDRFVFYQDVKRRRTLIIRLIRLLKLYKTLLSAKPKIIHSWSANLTIICYPYCLIAGARLIDSSISTNGLDGGFLFRFIRRLAIILANRVTTNSMIAQQNLNIQKTSIIVRNGVSSVNPIVFEGLIEYATVWFVSRMEPGKRVDLFIEAAKNLNAMLPNVRFKVVGDGSLLDRFCNDCKEYDFIEFSGHDSQFESQLEWGDLGVLISDSEGTPNVLLEFMSMGIPVVYWNKETDIDSPIAHGLTGFNVDSFDEVVSCLFKLLSDRNLYKLFSENSKIHIGQNYDISKNFIDFLNLYDD